MVHGLAVLFRQHRRFFMAIASMAGVLLALDALYVVAGHDFVTRAYARQHQVTLRDIIPTWVSPPLENYLEAADRLVRWFNLVALALVGALFPAEFCQPAIGRFHDAVVSACDRALARPRLLVAAAAVATFGVLVVLARVVYQNFPNSGDEYCYLYQAATWQAGRLWNPAHPLETFFAFDHVRNLDGRVFSVLPPGWPLLLLLASYAGVPLWLVNPLLGAMTVVALFGIGGRWFGQRVALIAVVTTICSSWFLLNSASFYAHSLCLLLILWFADAAVRGMQERSFWHGVLSGVCFGAAFATRFLTALLCGAPLGVLFLWRHRRAVRFAAGFALGSAPCLIAFLWYNHELMGTWLTLPMSGFEAYSRQWFAPDLLTRGTKILLRNLGSLLLWVPAAVVPAYLIALKHRPAPIGAAVLGWSFVAVVVGYYFYVDDGGNRYGPRYYYEALPYLVLPAVWYIFREPRWEAKRPVSRWLFYFYVLSMVVAVPIAGFHASVTREIIWDRSDLYRTVRDAGLSGAVVFVATPTGYREKMEPVALVRNGVDDRAAVLYVHDRGEANRQLIEYYPERRFYRYTYDPPARRGRLEALAR